MSFAGFVQAGAQLGLETITIRPNQRGIMRPTLADGTTTLADIVAQAVVEEKHTDQLEVTEHPLETGASITDHAYKKPAEVRLEMAWSNSPSRSGSLLMDAAIGAAVSVSPVVRQIADVVGVVQAAKSLFFDESEGPTITTVDRAYRQLLALQDSRALFTLYTGKRVYDNMICKMLMTETNDKTENALFITMICQEVLLVNTQTIELPKATQADPGATASPEDKGVNSAKPVSGMGK